MYLQVENCGGLRGVRPAKLNTRSAVPQAGGIVSQDLTSHNSNARKTSFSDVPVRVPPPDQDVNILGDVWSILVLANYSVSLDHRHLESVLYFQSCFVSFRYVW